MSNLKLLLVDDESGMRRGASRSLRRFKFQIQGINDDTFGIDITEASCGMEALGLLEENQYDIALLDYKLGDITGLEILGTIKEKEYDVLAIMMTAYASLEIAVSATKNGAFDFLAKPFTPEELRSVIKKAGTNVVLHRRAKKLEEEKKKVRFQFLSVLSHELKAPLNAVEGYLRIIDGKVAGNDINSYDKMLKRSLDRIGGMRKLIFDLLDLTRIESGQKVRQIAEINLVDSVNRSIETNGPIADKKGVTVELHSSDSVPINGDSSELEIMFNNLISNSIKYNEDNGRVDITLTQNDDAVKIAIADTGIGMKPEEKERLFGEFVRFKNEKTKNIEGSGLGLSILQKLVSLYDGEISVESEFGTGTTFNITLKSLPIEKPTDK
jgi:two-component system, sensor histidine kinase and response regulator